MFVARLLSGLMLTVSVSLAFSWAAGASGDAASEFSPIEPGSYQMAVGETEFSLDLEDAYWLISDTDPDMTVFSDPGLSGPIGRNVTFVSPSRLASPDPQNTTGDWPLDDIRGWLSESADQALAGEPVDMSWRGRAGLRFDVRLSEGVGRGALGFVATADGAEVSFEDGRDYRIWWIEDTNRAPLVVIASNNIEEHSMLPQAEDLLAGLVFDDAMGD